MQSPASRIQFHFLHKPVYLPNRTFLKVFLSKLFKKESKAIGHINYISCSDEYLLGINQSFLKHNTYTDIVTFELTRKDVPAIADIYISPDRVRENAIIFHTSFSTELRRVIIHGSLHLCGYRDKTSTEKKLMRHKEDEYLQLYSSTWNYNRKKH